MAEIKDITFKVESEMANLIQELRETAQAWIEGIEVHESEDCPEDLKTIHKAEGKAYKNCGEDIIRILERHNHK